MSLYEIVLRFSDRDEIRLTDQAGYRPGKETTIAGRRFRVIGIEPPQAFGAEARFVLEPCSTPVDPAAFAPFASPGSR